MLPISKTSAGPTMISSQRSLPTDEGITSSAPLGLELEQGALEPLAAGEDLGWRLLLVREDREEREDGPERLVTSRPRPRQEGAELEVLADGKRAEQTPPLGDHGEPARRDLVRRPPVDDLAAEPDHAGADRQEARERAQERGLARAVGPHQRDELAGADLERETAQHLEIAVAG